MKTLITILMATSATVGAALAQEKPTTASTPTGFESAKEHQDRGKNVNAPTIADGSAAKCKESSSEKCDFKRAMRERVVEGASN